MSSLADAARRVFDGYMDALMVDRQGRAGKWMAFLLDTGKTSGVIYDKRAVAVKFTPQPAMFLQLQPDGITIRAATHNLRFHRDMHDAGMRTGDPDAPTPILTNEMQKRTFS